KEVWNNSATAEEAKIAQSEELANTATAEAENNPSSAEQKATQAEDQALDAKGKTDNVKKEVDTGKTAEDRAAQQPPGVISPETAAWEKSLNPETQDFLKSNPELRKFWQEMDPDVRRILTLCATKCIPEDVSAENVARIKQLIQRLQLPSEDKGLREYLHTYSKKGDAQMSAALDALDSVKTPQEFRTFLDNKLIEVVKEKFG